METLKFKSLYRKEIFYSENHSKVAINKSYKEIKKSVKFRKELGLELLAKIDKEGNLKAIFESIIPKYFNKIDFISDNKFDKRLKISNYGLAIDKFGRFEEKALSYTTIDGKELFHEFNPHDASDASAKEILNYVKEKQENLFKELKLNFEVNKIDVGQISKLVLNLGASTAYNNSFLLHPIYGIPYLSDTAIKGMCRFYIIENYFNSKEEEALNDPDFKLLFGGKNKSESDAQGLVHFFNTFPTNTNFEIKMDIINNHNAVYYKSNNKTEYPKDTDKPNVLKFISLKGAHFSPFVFIKKTSNKVSISKNSRITEIQGNSLLKAIETILVKAFKIQGIGAKTNIAYGRLVTRKS